MLIRIVAGVLMIAVVGVFAVKRVPLPDPS